MACCGVCRAPSLVTDAQHSWGGAVGMDEEDEQFTMECGEMRLAGHPIRPIDPSVSTQ